MFKKILSFIAVAVLYCNSIMADNTLAIENLTGTQGGQVVMPVLMSNSNEITAFSFELSLPEGITLSNVENAVRAVDQNVTFNINNGIYYVATLSLTSSAYTGKSGEVCYLTLDIGEGATPGGKTIEINNIVLASPTTNKYKPSNISCTLSVTDPSTSYDFGYSIGVTPFVAESGNNYTIALNFNAKEENITNIDFDMELPPFLSRTKNGRKVIPFDSADEERLYIDGNEGDHSVTIDGNHVSIESIVNDEYRFIAGTEGALINMYYTSASSVAEGLYAVNFSNIILTDGDGNKINVAPTTSYIKVGNPIDASLIFTGLVTADVNDALAKDNALSSIDMRKVIRSEGSLILKDGINFNAPKYAFAENVAYTRPISSNWGTVCLPFALESNATVQYYKLSSVNDSHMTFEPVSSIEAGKPAVFKSLSGDVLSINATDVVICEGSKEMEQDVNNWTMRGTYSSFNNNPTECVNIIYYISNNKFWFADQTFPVTTFRGWFETQNTSAARVRAYSLAEYNSSTLIDFVEKKDGTVNVIFDLTGKKISNPQNGINIINGKKIITK